MDATSEFRTKRNIALLEATWRCRAFISASSGSSAAASAPASPIVRPPDQATFIDDLLYERRYSLLFEGGHRWIDLRRFMRDLPVNMPTEVRNVRYPFPQAECNARPGEPKCMLGST